MKAPVLLIAFNRPDFTSIVFETIRKYKPKKLYIAVNAPRKDRQDEVQRCKQVRNIVKSVDWDCEVHTLFRKDHLRLKLSVSGAIDWFFKNEERGIILEDDIVPESSFYFFCEELLERYKDDSRIGMISGDNFGFGYKRGEKSYYFSRYTHIWGWASWRRAWKDYDIDMKDYEKFVDQDRLSDVFQDPRERDFWKLAFGKVAYEDFETWDYQWVYCNLKNNRLNIMPSINLIKNIGFGETAAHTTETNSPYANMQVQSLSFPLKHPDFIVRDIWSDEFSVKTFLPPYKHPFVIFIARLHPRRVFNKVKRMISGILKGL